MVVDGILDRQSGIKYNEESLRYIYDCAMSANFFNLASAIDGGTNKDIQLGYWQT